MTVGGRCANRHGRRSRITSARVAITTAGGEHGAVDDGAVDDVAALFTRLPPGWSLVSYDGRRYGATLTVGLGGRSLKILAEELGGSDVLSANLYLTAHGPEFRPCEMPAAKVTAFLAGFELIEGPSLR